MCRIYRKTECAQMGSYSPDRCNGIYPIGTIRELGMAKKYPGYLTCEKTCGVIASVCLLPLPACSFMRLTQVLKCRSAREIARCMQCVPTVQVTVNVMLYNRGKQKSIKLLPYVMQKFGRNLSYCGFNSKATFSAYE